jgi:hypothetical protein
MILRRVGVWYKCPMTMNTANDVCEVHSKFDQRCLKSIAENRDGRGGFDDVCMAWELIKMCIHGLVRHIAMLFEGGQQRLRKIKDLEKYHELNNIVQGQLEHYVDLLSGMRKVLVYLPSTTCEVDVSLWTELVVSIQYIYATEDWTGIDRSSMVAYQLLDQLQPVQQWVGPDQL